ncbi:hypothetical protein BDN72DRAFT_652026 [Pluteus cervinus]|uniref:Uncharacterized protein n=1 Tax=Pluteus cervinus TaxID=181527 RepID=A0ACD3ASK8_9AGAR|nr:hypothetical protein BDN72DRAFT_652026 [Pluteus cervinus]
MRPHYLYRIELVLCVAGRGSGERLKTSDEAVLCSEMSWFLDAWTLELMLRSSLSLTLHGPGIQYFALVLYSSSARTIGFPFLLHGMESNPLLGNSSTRSKRTKFLVANLQFPFTPICHPVHLNIFAIQRN